jgi:hypothetical protein
MFEGLKRKIGLKRMRREYRNIRRTPRVSNLSSAQSVGLIYRVDDEEKLEVVKNYVKHLKEEEGIRKVFALGYVEGKELPEFLKAKLEFDYFCFKDMSWDFHPTGNAPKNFCEEAFDILIDMEREEIIPLRHVLNRSKARLKVGYYTQDFMHFYDIMIDVKTNEIVDYIAQVNYYLSILNKVS